LKALFSRTVNLSQTAAITFRCCNPKLRTGDRVTDSRHLFSPLTRQAVAFL
jgi:hypothetical protein